MKKVLILAWDFPPHTSVAAARPQSWFRHFYSQGIYPVIITRHWDLPLNAPEDTMRPSLIRETTIEQSPSGTLIRVPFKPWQTWLGMKPTGIPALLRKAISFLIVLLRYYSVRLDPDRILWIEARKYLKDNKVDCILATGEPFFLFSFAHRLSLEFSIPWIADYRDGWSANQLLRMDHSLQARLRTFMDTHHERRIIASASAITAAAPSYLEPAVQLRKQPVIHRVIYNGYEETTAPAGVPHRVDNEMTIAYSGRLYPHYPLEEFIQELHEFLLDTPHCSIHLLCLGLDFYPDEVKRIRKAMHNTGITLTSTGRLPYPEYIDRLRNAHMCLIFGVNGVRWLNAKIFDYFYAGRPVLLYKNDHDMLESLIVKTNSGFIWNDKMEFRNYLGKYMNAGENDFPSEMNPIHIREFSRKNQSLEMVKLILTCVE